MMYLLDVNALVALGLVHHEFHGRVGAWLRAQDFPLLATCSITELGFLRVLAQAPGYGFTISQARTLLLRMKQEKGAEFRFIPDDHDVSHLPGWVKTAGQITDGHLLKLAGAKQALLATLDARIPGAYLIPDK
jgi:uncharacterized protein